MTAGAAGARSEANVIMRIKTEELKETRIALEFETPADRFPILREMVRGGECDFTDPIRTRLRAARIGDMVEVEGDIRTTVRLSCGRCLVEFVSPLETAFTLTYAQQEPAAGEQSEPGPTRWTSRGKASFISRAWTSTSPRGSRNRWFSPCP